MYDVRESNFGRVIERFYEAAVLPGQWREVLHEAAVAVGAAGGLIHCYPDSTAGMYYSAGLDEVIDRFTKADDSRYVRVVRGVSLDPWAVQSESSLFEPDELADLALYNEVLLPSGLKWFAGTTVSRIGDESVLLSFERSARAEAYSNDEIAVVTRLLPHLRSACRLAQHLGMSRAEGALDAFDAMRCAAVLVGRRGRVIRLNRMAEATMGRDFSLRQGRLAIDDARANRLLDARLAQCLQTGGTPSDCDPVPVVVPRQTGRPLLVRVAPIEGAAGDVLQDAKAIVSIVDPDRDLDQPVGLLRRAYGLTEAEARVAVAIGRGRDLADIADNHGVSIETVRAQLKVAFAKTRTRRQGELAALVARLIDARS